MPRLVAAPDKFRGTATAAQVVEAVGAAATAAGWAHQGVPMADGGEGTLDALGGPNRTTTVTGPLGDPVDAAWRFDRRTAVIEMARASGLELVAGAEGNDPIAASTYGTGELIAAAIDLGARRIIVALGGSATTDGGLGALRALPPLPRLRGIELIVACDVRTTFVDAAETFAGQKGATPAQIELLRRRLDRLADVYLEEHGVDVHELAGSGAAGGLGGGLAAVGATLTNGFDLVADELDLAVAIEGGADADGDGDETSAPADLVVTGEGFLDAESFDGKVVGGVVALATTAEVPCLIVVGAADPELDVTLLGGATVIDLTARFGEDAARRDTTTLIEQVVAEHLEGPSAARP